MNADPDPGARPARPEAGDGSTYAVDAQGAVGVQVGDQGTQINYIYTWTDDLAPRPLVVSGKITSSPYRGLRAFGEEDAALFFGRDSAAAKVLELMSQRLEGAGLLVISGVSGAGKSSLLRAGVLPRFRGAGLASAPEAASWPCLVFTPTRRPLDELAVRVATMAGTDAGAVRRGLATDPAGFALTVRQTALAHVGGPAQGMAVTDGAGQQRVLLVVDQFEQVFTRCEQEEEQRAFITALHAAATAAGGDEQLPAAVVVLVVRADFEARLADYPSLAPAVQDRYLLTAMTSVQLQMAITQPAAVAGASVDDDLVRVLLEEVRTHAGSRAGGSGGTAISAGVLPLLSYALDQAWRGRTGPALTLADYERTGGLQGAVASSAQRAYDRLTRAQQAAARQVFIGLTATTSDGLDTTARVDRADLTVGKNPAQAQDVEAVLETFAAERLLTLAAGTVEISHEALLTAWPLLRDSWLADTHADRMIRSRLHATAQEWADASRDPSYLYSGSRLETAAETAARICSDGRHPPLNQTETDFLDASQRAHRRRTRRRQGFTVILLALVVGLAAAAVTAVDSSHASNRQRDIAISGQLATESEALANTNAPVSRLESLAAWAVYPSAQSRYAMLASAASPEIATLNDGYAVKSVAFSPDGKTLATGDNDGTAQLWNIASGHRIASLRTGDFQTVGSVAFSPDGKTLATDHNDGTAQLWNIASGHRIASLRTGDFQTVGSVAFSPDGKTLATGEASGPARLWNLTTGHQIASLRTGFGNAGLVAFSPDGETLVTGENDSTVRLWNVATGRQITSLPSGDFQTVGSVAFSPDGKTLVTGEADGTARLWNLATGRQIASLSLPSGLGQVESVAFSPDGKTLATGNNDGTARLWNLASRSLSTGDLVTVDSVAFSPDGKTLVTGDNDGMARLWNVVTGHHIASLRTGSQTVGSVAFSPDGKTLATGDTGGPVQLWNVASGRRITSLPLPVGLSPSFLQVESVAFSPDGKTLATGEVGGPAQLWNLATGRQITRLRTGSGTVNSVAFSPDGKTLVTGDTDGTARRWNVATGRQIASLPTGSGTVNSVAFSPDGKTLATGDDDGTAQLWNLATGRQITRLRTGSGTVNSVAFSPDGKTLTTGDTGGPAQLWDLATGRQIAILPTGSRTVNSVAFSPDGKTLATGEASGPAQLWKVGYLVDVLPRLCAQVGDSLTRTEWGRYVPPGPGYRDVCARHH